MIALEYFAVYAAIGVATFVGLSYFLPEWDDDMSNLPSGLVAIFWPIILCIVFPSYLMYRLHLIISKAGKKRIERNKAKKLRIANNPKTEDYIEEANEEVEAMLRGKR